MNGRYRSLPALQMRNICINLALLKNNFAVHFIMVNVVAIIKIVLKFFNQMIDAEARRFEVMITSLLLTLK